MAGAMHRPRSLEEAQKFTGATLLKRFNGESGKKQWYKGEVTEVADQWRDSDTQQIIYCEKNDFVFFVSYEDGDSECLDWNEVKKGIQAAGKMPSVSQAGLTQQVGEKHARPASPNENADREAGKRARSDGGEAGPSNHVLGEMDINQQRQKVRHNGASKPLKSQGSQQLNATQPDNATEKAATQRNTNNNRQNHADGGGVEGTQAVAVQRAVPRASLDELRTEGLAGHLKHIKLEDFMCHKNFEMKFGPHVTVISGTNGSGKSAVMQGLQACLGVSARETGRSKQLTDFIRTGADVSVVKVTLWNEGPDAYRPELYGKEITIERRIRRSGGGDYKLYGVQRTGRGAAVSTKKDEIDIVLDHFNINAANPLTVITQDMARTFLHGNASGKRAKYDMYMEGTMLLDIQESISNSDKGIKSIRDYLTSNKEGLKKREAELRELEANYDKVRAMEESGATADALEAITPILYQREMEAKLDEATTKLDTEKVKLERALVLQTKLGVGLVEAEATCEAKTAEMQYAMTATDRRNEELTVLRNAVNRRAAETRNVKLRMAKHEANMKGIQEAIKEAEKALTNGSQKDTQKLMQVRQQIKETSEKAEQLAANLRTVEAAYAEKRKEYQELKLQFDDKIKQRGLMDQDLRNKHMELTGLHQQLNAMANTRDAKFAVFGAEKTRRLHELIEQNIRQFRHQPIGPLGVYLGLTHTNWSRAAECALGSLLNRWLCFDSRDKETLQRLARQAGLPNLSLNILKPNIGKYNVQAPRLPDGCVSLLDVLRITEDSAYVYANVFNFLIDMAQVENVALVDNPKVARDIVHSDAVQGVFAIDKDGFNARKMGGTVVAKNFNMRHPPRIGLDSTEMKAQLEMIIQDRRHALDDLTARITQCTHEAEELQAATRQTNKEQADLMKQIQVYKSQQRQLLDQVSKMSAMASNTDEDDAYEQRVIMATQFITQHNVELSSTQVLLDGTERDLEEAKAAEQEARDALEAKRNEPLPDINKYNDDVELAAAAVARVRKAIQKNDEDVAMLQELVSAAEQELEAWKARVDEAVGITQATQGNDTQAAEIKARLHFIRKLLADQQHRGRARKRNLAQRDGQGAQHDEQHELRELEEELTPELRAKLDQECHSDNTLDEAKRLRAMVEAAQQSAGGSAKELEYEVEKERNKFAKEKIKTDQMKDLTIKLATSFNTRLNSFHKLRDEIKTVSQLHFNKYMQRRLHLGQLDVKDELKELNLKVKVKGKEDDKAKWVDDLKQLSGGERSYTAVALLLALGQWSESPFRCLDEYDVFMDAINRRIATETLLEFAYTEARERQYVLLTPQDLSAIELAKREMETKKGVQLPASFLTMFAMARARPGQ